MLGCVQASDVAADTRKASSIKAVHSCMKSVDKDEQQTAVRAAPDLSPQHCTDSPLEPQTGSFQEVRGQVLSSEIKWKIKLWLKTILICHYQTNTDAEVSLKPSSFFVSRAVWAPASVESGCAHRDLCIAVTLKLRSNLRQLLKSLILLFLSASVYPGWRSEITKLSPSHWCFMSSDWTDFLLSVKHLRSLHGVKRSWFLTLLINNQD